MGGIDTYPKSDIVAELIEDVGRIAQEYSRMSIKEFDTLVRDYAPSIWSLYKGACEDYGAAELKRDFPDIVRGVRIFERSLTFA